jgi:hypothetical protein
VGQPLAHSQDPLRPPVRRRRRPSDSPDADGPGRRPRSGKPRSVMHIPPAGRVRPPGSRHSPTLGDRVVPASDRAGCPKSSSRPVPLGRRGAASRSTSPRCARAGDPIEHTRVRSFDSTPKSARSRSIARSTCRFARPNPPDCVIVVQGDIGTRFGERPSLAGGLSDRVTPHYEPATHTGPVALHRARRGALVRAGADHLGRIGVDQRLKHQLHRTTNKSRSPTTADRVRQVDTLRVRESHRVFSFAC